MEEVELLKELAGDISLGINKIRQQNEISKCRGKIRHAGRKQ